jgi:hypothetical protein
MEGAVASFARVLSSSSRRLIFAMERTRAATNWAGTGQEVRLR